GRRLALDLVRLEQDRTRSAATFQAGEDFRDLRKRRAVRSVLGPPKRETEEARREHCGTDDANWGISYRWACVSGSADLAGWPGRLFHVRRAVPGEAAALAARHFARHANRRWRASHPFPDYVFHRADSGAAERLRAAQVRRDKFCCQRCCNLHDPGTGAADYRNRGHRTVRLGVRRGNRDDEGHGRNRRTGNDGHRPDSLPGESEMYTYDGDDAVLVDF